MEYEDIRITHTIVHILDSTVGTAVLSNQLLDHGSDFGDLIRSHISRVMSSDEGKQCEFDREESQVYKQLMEIGEETFIPVTQEIARQLYEIMNQNIDIPSADLLISRYEWNGHAGLAFLKLNYRSSYTHLTSYTEAGNSNEIVKQNAILPGESQKLTEAALIDLDDFSIRLVEKKYEVNGVKTNYFSQMFLQCRGRMSPKTKLNLVTKAVEDIQKNFYDDSEQWEVKMEAKSIISQELMEQGALDIPLVVDKIFREKPELKEEFHEKMEKYHLTDTQVEIKNPSTAKKFEKQHILTDTGIEIKIPMEEYQSGNSVEFITNPDGSISVLIKNIGSIISK